MLSKATILSLVAVSLAVLGGVGYATFTSTVNLTATATAGTLHIVIDSANANVATAGDSITSCSVTIPAGSTTKATITAGNLFPGDTGCTYTIVLKNTGSLPATSFTVTYNNLDTTCSGTPFPGSGAFSVCFRYSDTLGGVDTHFPCATPTCPVAVTLQPGATITYQSTISMHSLLGNNVQGLSDSMSVDITGSIGS